MIELDRQWLLSAMKTANTAVNRRSPKPVLTRLLLQIASGHAIVHGTDTETSISVATEVGSSEWSKALLPPVQVMPFLDSSESPTVQLTTDKNSVTVRCGVSQVTLNTENPDEFPIPQLTKSEDLTKVDGKAFHQAIKRVLYACDEDSTRFALGAIKLEDTASSLQCIGTDGKRLSLAEIDAIAVGGMENGMLPVKGAKAILSMHLDEAWLWTNGANICLSDSSGSIMFSTRQTEGRYPNWRQVIPQLGDYTKAVVARDALLRLLRQAAIAAAVDTRAVDFRFENGNLLAAASSADLGSSSVQMPIEFEGEISTRLDHRLTSDFVEQADETIDIYLKNHLSPVYLKSGNYQGVLMPMAMES